MNDRIMEVFAHRPEREHEDERHWMRVGIATVMSDGDVLLTVDATPLNWDGVLKLKPLKKTTLPKPLLEE